MQQLVELAGNDELCAFLLLYQPLLHCLVSAKFGTILSHTVSTSPGGTGYCSGIKPVPPPLSFWRSVACVLRHGCVRPMGVMCGCGGLVIILRILEFTIYFQFQSGRGHNLGYSSTHQSKPTSRFVGADISRT